MQRQKRAPRAAVITLGCRVNQYESDAIAEALEAAGFTVVPAGSAVDVTVVNTCTVTAESDRKSRQHIRRAAAASPGGHVIVTGCFAQVSPDSAASIAGVRAVLGNGDKAQIARVARAIVDGETDYPCRPSDIMCAPYDNITLRSPRRTRSYIKIEDGCENRCAYCIIPQARGRVRSKLPADVLREAAAIAQAGCGEIILTGIETAAYGRDSGGAFSLASLMEQLSGIDGLRRIGLGSMDPSLMKDSFLETVSRLPAVLPHFHLSLQSGCSSVLRRMRRPYNAVQAMDRIRAIRRTFGEVMLTGDVIVGFPGETEEEFAETLAFCREAEFLHLHIFPYSIRRDTEAAAMPDQVPETVKKQRAARLAALQAEIKRELLRKYVNDHRDVPVQVLAEEKKGDIWIGHSEHYAEVRFSADGAEPGMILSVFLEDTDGDTVSGHV